MQSEYYVNTLILFTEKDIGKGGILTDDQLDEENEARCNDMWAQACKWDIKINGKSVEKVTKSNFYQVKGVILSVIRKRLEEMEVEEEFEPGGLPPRVGIKPLPEKPPEEYFENPEKEDVRKEKIKKKVRKK